MRNAAVPSWYYLAARWTRWQESHLSIRQRRKLHGEGRIYPLRYGLLCRHSTVKQATSTLSAFDCVLPSRKKRQVNHCLSPQRKISVAHVYSSLYRDSETASVDGSIARGLLVASRGHFSEKVCVSVASRSV